MLARDTIFHLVHPSNRPLPLISTCMAFVIPCARFSWPPSVRRWLLTVSLALTPIPMSLQAAADPTPMAGAEAAGADTLWTPPSDSISSRQQSTERSLAELGLENLTVDAETTPPRIAFENRRYRHTLDALGRIERVQGAPIVAFERRLGLLSAALSRTGPPEEPKFQVVFPSDANFPDPPLGPVVRPTSRSVDFLLGPLIGYEFGRFTEAIQLQFELEPQIRYNPWPGALASASMIIPIYNDFFPSRLHPDVDQVRPGVLRLDQFAWVPRTALVSGTAGLLGDNRYGVSFGAARPVAQGMFLVDAQADLTGFIAFNEDGTEYSEPNQWTTFAGLTWRPPLNDLAVRLRVAKFLFGDHGGELEVKRSFGDFDFALFSVRSSVLHFEGIRVSFPIPPLTRSTRGAIHLQPIERFPMSFRSNATPAGTFLGGVASREDFLRQLSAPSLNANPERFRRARGEKVPRPRSEFPDWVASTGSTGFINTPWAGVIDNGAVEVGYTKIPKQWGYTYKERGVNPNEIYYAVVGLFPRFESTLRITRIPGLHAFSDIIPGTDLTTDTDHMVSTRVMGTRRYHASYLVAGIPFSILHVQNRFSLGYASRVFTAVRHVLDGAFGALEVSPWRSVVGRIENDTEKWNVGMGIELGFGLRLQVAALNMESLSVGGGWHRKL
jgi:hypothetical protein